jgi:hypothetical protein
LINFVEIHQTLCKGSRRILSLRPLFHYLSLNKQSYRDAIYQNKFHWEKFDTEWFRQDLSPRIYIRRIYPGHWAWSDELEQRGSHTDAVLTPTKFFIFHLQRHFFVFFFSRENGSQVRQTIRSCSCK